MTAMEGMSEHSYTCITCQVRFPDSEMHRSHFQSEWHRYNLKRKVADLAVVSIAVFETKKEQHEKQSKDGEKKAPKASTYCIACGKNFKTAKAYENHIASKKHLEMILKFETKPEKEQEEEEKKDDKVGDMEVVEEVESDEWEDDDPIPITDCLFCDHHSNNLEKNLTHMTGEHSFFLPDPEFLTSIKGLIEYLGAKVGQGHMCLWCNDRGKRFETKEDVQRHMVSKGHCKMLHEGEALLEYDEWYDYSSSYPEGEGAKEEEVQLDMLDDTGYELRLPSGATIGHRSLLRYYRQSCNPVKVVAVSRHPHGMGSSGRQLLPSYRNLGWTGTCGKESRRKAKDLMHMKRLQQRHWMWLGVKGNMLRGNTHILDRNGMC